MEQRYRTLRIWITNEVDDQPWQSNMNMDSFDFSNNLESSYRVKIEGRLLDDDDDGEKEVEEKAAAVDKMDTDANAAKQAQQGPKGKLASAKRGDRYRFSHFFKSLTVDVDRTKTRSATDPIVEWKKPDRTPAGSNLPAAADFDELTFKRNGDENTNITISLFRHEDPERFTLGADLAEVVDMKEATRAEVIMGLWDYIKVMNLQEEEEKRNFRCDELLKKVSNDCDHSRRRGLKVCRTAVAAAAAITTSEATRVLLTETPLG
jgi:SWI/SNF-related matrix-associated actin-dependent regulator of chromatin subfamily D